MNQHIEALDEVLKLAKAAQWVADNHITVSHDSDGYDTEENEYYRPISLCWQCKGIMGEMHGETWLDAIERYQKKWTY